MLFTRSFPRTTSRRSTTPPCSKSVWPEPNQAWDPRPASLHKNIESMKVLMPRISRRDLIASGLALSTSALVARSAWAGTADMLGSDTPAVSANPVPGFVPREELLFDNGWKFKFGNGNDPSKDMGFGFGQAQ